MAAIEIENLTKRYASRFAPLTAVDRLNLSIQEGEIFGFVGPNGAGKTSTLRMVATLLQPTAGEVWVHGYSARRSPQKVRRIIGYMPDFFGVYPDMTVWEYLDFFAACYEIPENERRQLIEDLLELVDLTCCRQDWVDKLSRGMKQRLSLARMLVHDPQVLILDEPASGLDPRARVEIRELLVELARLGKTIFFSTHILSDAAQICSRVGIIESGRLVAVGELAELQQKLENSRVIEIAVLGELDEAIAAVKKSPGVSAILQVLGQHNGKPHRLKIEFAGEDAALSQVLATLLDQGIPVVQFSEEDHDLEKVFLRLTQRLAA